VSLPTLLLVDDSEAILSYEKAALGGLYLCHTAADGKLALEQLRHMTPDAMLLDLSMPGMSGDQVLEVMRADPTLATIPVIIVSSERTRAESFVGHGAVAYLAKPVRADDLRATVARVIDQAYAQRRTRSLAAMTVVLGPLELGVPLDAVRAVELMPLTKALSGGLGPVKEAVDFHGRPVAVLDLAARLHIQHHAPLVERKLVFVRDREQLLAFAVDGVKDPEELPAEAVVLREAFAADARMAGRALRAVARTDRGLLPIVDPSSFFSHALLAKLPQALGSLPDLGEAMP
jgi:CheY-like chemotaxis protein